MLGLMSPLGLMVVGFYFYVAVAIVRAEYKAGTRLTVALPKALIWPVTIWDTIENLYKTEPRLPE